MLPWIIISALLLGLLVVYLFSREHMTNNDLISTLKTFGDKGTKTSKKTQPSDTNSMPILGPKAPAIDPADRKIAGATGTNTSGVYPDIYGPDVPKLPGTTTTKTHMSDETYEFNPDLKKAFPVEGPPQPFLTDFSKFQH